MSHRTQGPSCGMKVVRLRDYHPLWSHFPEMFSFCLHPAFLTALQPRLLESSRFGLFPVRSPLLWESQLISFPLDTKMFQFSRLP